MSSAHGGTCNCLKGLVRKSLCELSWLNFLDYVGVGFRRLNTDTSDDRNAATCPKQESTALRYRGIKMMVDRPFTAGIHAIIDIVSWTTAVSGACNSKSKQLASNGSIRVSSGIAA